MFWTVTLLLKRQQLYKISANMFYWHFMFLNFLFNDKVFQLHMFNTFRILVVLENKTIAELSQ